MQMGNLGQLQTLLERNNIIAAIADVFTQTHQSLGQILTRFDFQNRSFDSINTLVDAVIEALGPLDFNTMTAMTNNVVGALSRYPMANTAETVVNDFSRAYHRYFGVPMMRSEAIPRIIHRFWAGGAMSAITINNIIQMQQVVVKGKWHQILWTSWAVNKVINDPQLLKQLAILSDMGVKVLDITDLTAELGETLPGYTDASNVRVAAAVKGVTKKKREYTDVKFLSDFVRLSATYLQGGVYMDTDIGPGLLDLSGVTLYHRDRSGEVPLVGPQVQNSASYARERTGTASGPRLNLFASTAARLQPVFNFFYATRAGTDSNLAGLNYMIKYPECSGMNAADAHFALATDPRQWLVPWVMDLAWTTEASDMEESSSSSKSQKTVSYDLDFDTLVGVNNCLITAINNGVATDEQLWNIRLALVTEGFNIGEMLVAGPRTIRIIRQVLGINNPLVVHYQDRPDENFAGTGPTIHITHNGDNHFTRGGG